MKTAENLQLSSRHFEVPLGQRVYAEEVNGGVSALMEMATPGQFVAVSNRSTLKETLSLYAEGHHN